MMDDQSVQASAIAEGAASGDGLAVRARTPGGGSSSQGPTTAGWLVGDGDIIELIRTKDWSATPLGALDSWSVRAMPGLHSVRLLMLTFSGAGRAEAEEAGVDGFATKPVRESRLASEIARLLDRFPTAERGGEPGPVPREIADVRAVLVAEDNPVNELVITRLLEKRGFNVDIARDGRQAVAMHGRRTYALIFMDCQMPELDGYQATATIRLRDTSAHRVPIVAITANTLKGDRERCLQAGMDDYLSKPIRTEDLDAVLGRVLGRVRGEKC